MVEKPLPEEKLDELLDRGARTIPERANFGEAKEYCLRDKQGLLDYFQDCQIKLISTQWLVRTWKEKPEILLRRCQELPDEAFFSGSLVTQVIYAVSYPWHSPGHPDPEGALSEALATYFRPMPDRPLYWDHKSLPQHRIDARWSGQTWEDNKYKRIFPAAFLDVRDEPETRFFSLALANAHVPFWHRSTKVVVFPELPELAKNPMPYSERGWPLLELTGATLCGGSMEVLDMKGCDLKIRGAAAMLDLLGPVVPASPEAFKELLAARSFARKGDEFRADDAEEVAAIYERAFKQTLGEMTLEVGACMAPSRLPVVMATLPLYEQLKEIRIGTNAAEGLTEKEIKAAWATFAPFIAKLPMRPLEVWGAEKLIPPKKEQREMEKAGVKLFFK